tara:strand:+ start:1036 stop:1233 length:198 start_codon:yes stop_codon:yes gene_type:complete
MQLGDLVYLRPKNLREEDDLIGLLVHMEQVGRAKIDSTILYDVLLAETNEVLTISDIYFEIWRVE